MRNYEQHNQWQKLLTPDIVALLTQIHEFKGEQNLFIEANRDTLTQLVELAKIQSTEASNKIEGIFTSDERLKKIVLDKTTPQTRNEQEIAGYRDGPTTSPARTVRSATASCGCSWAPCAPPPADMPRRTCST